MVQARGGPWAFLVVFLESSGVLEEDHRVRSQGEDKVTDWVEALGHHQAAESNPSRTHRATNSDQIHHPALSKHVSSWTQYCFHMCMWAWLYGSTQNQAYQHTAHSRTLTKAAFWRNNGCMKSICELQKVIMCKGSPIICTKRASTTGH